MKKNRRGFLLAEETLKIIIAVICILFLAYFLISLYLKSSADKDLEMAKASLEHLVDEINAGHDSVEIYNPEGWVISSWPHYVSKGTPGFRISVNDKPKSCDNLEWNNCLCICKATIFLNLEGEDCDKKGFCLQSGVKVEEDEIKIVPPLTLKISGGKITK